MKKKRTTLNGYQNIGKKRGIGRRREGRATEKEGKSDSSKIMVSVQTKEGGGKRLNNQTKKKKGRKGLQNGGKLNHSL